LLKKKRDLKKMVIQQYYGTGTAGVSKCKQ